ncbi:hypothetical protein BDZ97DRAFT_1756951 [Flammula alnicola]|nr:hypothetical protein BDZ97DRAFT_1756951 [Flammula alnicola]
MAAPSASLSQTSETQQYEKIQILKALHDHAYETREVEHPWYLLWNECFHHLDLLTSDKNIYLMTGPQQQFTTRKRPVVEVPPASTIVTRQSNSLNSVELVALDEGEDCPMADASFGSHITRDGGAATEESVDRFRIPDFTIYRYMLQFSGRPILPTGIIENKPLGDITLDNSFLDMLDAEGALAAIRLRDQKSARLAMDRTIIQARQQLECLFSEYPQVAGRPDPLPKVYHLIIVGGWYRIHEITRQNVADINAWLADNDSPHYIFNDTNDGLNPDLLEFWPKLRQA